MQFAARYPARRIASAPLGSTLLDVPRIGLGLESARLLGGRHSRAREGAPASWGQAAALSWPSSLGACMRSFFGSV